MSIDHPLARFRGRTFRELVLIVAAVALVIVEYRHNSGVTSAPFALLAVMFAARMFPARVVYVSTCISAIALRAGYVLGPENTLADSALPLAGITVLAVLACGRDLVRRFDDEGRAVGCFSNYWRTLATSDRRRIAWMSHALAACGATLYFAHDRIALLPDMPGYLAGGMVACGVAGLLLLWGRAIAAPVTLAVGAYIASSIAPKLAAAVRALDGNDVLASADVQYSGGYLIVAFVCASVACVVALPWSLRFLRALAASHHAR
jgi:hypothetical protein